jgi:hypothetical protein
MKLLLLLVLLTSCSGEKKKEITYNYPDDLKDQFSIGFNGAKYCIEQQGTPLTVKSSIELRKHKGTKKFKEGWGWYDPNNNFYVLGLCHGDVIEVGVNPATGGEANQAVILHEFGHYWLMSNYNIRNHDPRFTKCFYNWNDATVSFTKSRLQSFYDKRDQSIKLIVREKK